MIQLTEVIKLGLSNRDGEIMIGRGSDGFCYLIAEADTCHNAETFTGLGSTSHIVITKDAFLALSRTPPQEPDAHLLKPSNTP